MNVFAVSVIDIGCQCCVQYLYANRCCRCTGLTCLGHCCVTMSIDCNGSGGGEFTLLFFGIGFVGMIVRFS